MDASKTLNEKQKKVGYGPGSLRQQKTVNPKKVTDNFSLDREPLHKLKNYVLAQKLKGTKISTSSVINDLIKNKVRELDL